MTKYFATVFLVLAVAFGLLGVSAWANCGYDCPIYVFSGVTATEAILLAAAALVIALGLAIADFLSGLVNNLYVNYVAIDSWLAPASASTCA